VAKVRVHELAKELGITSKDAVTKLQELGEFVRSASSTIEAPVVRKLRNAYPDAAAKAAAPEGICSGPACCPAVNQRSTAVAPVAPLRALPNARRLTARARHVSLGCSHAPLPAIRRRSSTSTAVEPLPSATSRSNCDRGAFFRHPMQVRSG
jgi:translation initiation factor IF-2